MIQIKNLSFQYSGNISAILKHINLDIHEGETIAIVGKNGSGKSTIGKLLSGILKVKQGQILIDDIDISKKKNEKIFRDKIGIVFQNPENQIIFNNIYDEISFSLNHLEKEEIEKRITSSLQDVEMSEYIDKDLYTLSLGQKQRIVIAEILAKHPKYIVFDEPTTMIDSYGKEKIYHIMENLKKEGYTIICITNLADEILLADRTIILDNGEIVSEIKKDELIEKSSELEKYQIKLPTILHLLLELKKHNINISLKNYSVNELAEILKEKLFI